MSVIIRLQNLPWTANARDIRNFFTGLSIPEGGVHIIGGEMGDAFIAFSTDEDARCAMLKDREKLMEVQVRLLLSSRAEMQKVIETARKVSAAAAAVVAAVAPPTPTPTVLPQAPQPPIIGSFLSQQQQQPLKQQLGLTAGPVAAPAAVPSFLAYQQQAGITLADVASVKSERQTPERQGHFSSSRGLRLSRSHSRSSSSDDSDSRERDRDTRDRDSRDGRGRKRRPDLRSDSSERELKMPPKANISPWAIAPAAAVVAPVAAAAATVAALPGVSHVPGLQQQLSIMSVLPPVQSYSTNNSYNLNLSAAPQQQPHPQQQQQQQSQQQPQPDLPKSQEQQPIAFANVNPYAQMYPQLFQQQQLLLQQQAAKAAAGQGNSSDPDVVIVSGGSPVAETCYIKISGMCPSTSYSDLRKYFAGLYIPHNGIKIVNGANGARNGIAYIEFSRVSSAQKALSRNNTMFRDRLVQIVPIGDEEFEQVDERAQRGGGGNNSSRGEARNSSAAQAAQSSILVLYVEDLPQLTTEQDIMKMFSATCTIVDILLTASPNNRREFVAFVLFARENEARSALEDTSRHYIGFRKLRVRASNQGEMQNAKDKMRRANEQLQKEEQQQREDAERELLNKQQQQQLLQQQQQQQLLQQQKQQQQLQQEQLLALQAKFSSDPRRRNIEPSQQQQQQHPHSSSNHPNNLQPFVNMPLAFQQQQNNGNNMPMGNNGSNMPMNSGNMPLNSNNMPMNSNNMPINSSNMPINSSNMPMNSPHGSNMSMNSPHGSNMSVNSNNIPMNINSMPQNHNNNMPMNPNNMPINHNNMDPFAMQMLNNNGNNSQQMQHQQQQQHNQQQPPRRQEDVFVRVHNCEYATRINDLGELFLSEQLRIEHIEMLFNDRNQSAGEFIVEFVDAHNAKMAIREFHNRRFRGRGLRLSPITPQEIADRMNKPFMDYLPGGNGPRQVDKGALSPPQQQQSQQQSSSRRRGPSRFDDAESRSQQPSQPTPHDSDDSNSSKQQHFNPFAARGNGPDLSHDELGSSSPMPPPSMNGSITDDCPPANNGIPDKFNRPGCVVAMRNVPFKADLKDILRFFNEYKLSPDDIIRRFNDEGKPTGDARVAFESESEARSAFESRRRKQIFNRTVYLDII